MDEVRTPPRDEPMAREGDALASLLRRFHFRSPWPANGWGWQSLKMAIFDAVFLVRESAVSQMQKRPAPSPPFEALLKAIPSDGMGASTQGMEHQLLSATMNCDFHTYVLTSAARS